MTKTIYVPDDDETVIEIICAIAECTGAGECMDPKNYNWDDH